MLLDVMGSSATTRLLDGAPAACSSTSIPASPRCGAARLGGCPQPVTTRTSQWDANIGRRDAGSRPVDRLAHHPPTGGARTLARAGRRRTGDHDGRGWRGPFAPIEYEGETYGLRADRVPPVRVVAAPNRRLVEDSRSTSTRPTGATTSSWSARDGRSPSRGVADGVTNYRSYVQQSSAELMIAKGMYVKTRADGSAIAAPPISHPGDRCSRRTRGWLTITPPEPASSPLRRSTRQSKEWSASRRSRAPRRRGPPHRRGVLRLRSCARLAAPRPGRDGKRRVTVAGGGAGRQPVTRGAVVVRRGGRGVARLRAARARRVPPPRAPLRREGVVRAGNTAEGALRSPGGRTRRRQAGEGPRDRGRLPLRVSEGRRQRRRDRAPRRQREEVAAHGRARRRRSASSSGGPTAGGASRKRGPTPTSATRAS